VAEEQYDDAVTLQEQIANVIGSHKVAALLHQMEMAVVEERYLDAARIRDELQALDAESAEREKIVFEEHE
jgi:protein-arginine kinase activator protein McsA